MSAGASFQTGIAIGKFHGVIRPTTPSGRRTRVEPLVARPTARRPRRPAATPHPPSSAGSRGAQRLQPRLAQRLAHLGGHVLRDLLGARLDRVGRLREERRALPAREAPPRRGTPRAQPRSRRARPRPSRPDRRRSPRTAARDCASRTSRRRRSRAIRRRCSLRGGAPVRVSVIGRAPFRSARRRARRGSTSVPISGTWISTTWPGREA